MHRPTLTIPIAILLVAVVLLGVITGQVNLILGGLILLATFGWWLRVQSRSG